MGTTYKEIEKEQRTDHRGIVYGSEKDMCKAYGLTVDTYRKRIRRSGWTKKDALETPVKVYRNSKDDRTDHIGNIFVSAKEMCRHWGVSYKAYLYRRNAGYDLKRALTEK